MSWDWARGGLSEDKRQEAIFARERARWDQASPSMAAHDPPKSARKRRDVRSSPLSASVWVSERMTRACARDERSFIAVAARRLHRSPCANNPRALATESTSTSARPSSTHRLHKARASGRRTLVRAGEKAKQL